VIKHLSAQGRLDEGEGSIVSGVQTKLEPLLSASDTLTIIQNGLEMRKLQPPKYKGSKTQKSKPSNTERVGS
jgi:hypothetical protein